MSTMSQATTISIIMPCHNRAYDLERILKAYDAQILEEPFELIAVDDASSDQTYALLSSYRPARYSLCVERLEKNSGPAAARNRGIARARSELILFVGDDILPEPELVRGHLLAHRHYPAKEIAILGHIAWPSDFPCNTLMTHIDGVGAQQFSYHYLRHGQTYDFRHLYTANVSLKREFLYALEHWFDTDFIYPAFEDAELGFRLTKRGLRIIYLANLRARHYHYHTIFSFSVRQYRCGLMAWVLMRKHPDAISVFKAQFLKLGAMLRRLDASLKPTEIVSHLEEQMLHLASFYEWDPHALLDRLYLEVLDYYYYKGLIDGILGNSDIAKLARKMHALCSLAPLHKSYTQEATRAGIPLPPGWNIGQQKWQ